MIKKCVLALVFCSSFCFAGSRFDTNTEEEYAFREEMLNLLTSINRNLNQIKDEITMQRLLLNRIQEMYSQQIDQVFYQVHSTKPLHYNPQ